MHIYQGPCEMQFYVLSKNEGQIWRKCVDICCQCAIKRGDSGQKHDQRNKMYDMLPFSHPKQCCVASYK